MNFFNGDVLLNMKGGERIIPLDNSRMTVEEKVIEVPIYDNSNVINPRKYIKRNRKNDNRIRYKNRYDRYQSNNDRDRDYNDRFNDRDYNDRFNDRDYDDRDYNDRFNDRFNDRDYDDDRYNKLERRKIYKYNRKISDKYNRKNDNLFDDFDL